MSLNQYVYSDLTAATVTVERETVEMERRASAMVIATLKREKQEITARTTAAFLRERARWEREKALLKENDVAAGSSSSSSSSSSFSVVKIGLHFLVFHQVFSSSWRNIFLSSLFFVCRRVLSHSLRHHLHLLHLHLLLLLLLHRNNHPLLLLGHFLSRHCPDTILRCSRCKIITTLFLVFISSNSTRIFFFTLCFFVWVLLFFSSGRFMGLLPWYWSRCCGVQRMATSTSYCKQTQNIT